MAATRRYTTEFVLDGNSAGAVRANEEARQSTERLTREMAATEAQAEATSQGFVSVATRATALASSIGLSVTGLGAMTVSTANAVREQINLSNSVGVSVQTLQSWGFAARQVGIDGDKMGDIFKDTADKIGDAFANGGGEAMDALNALNLSAEDLINLSPDQQILAIGKRLNELPKAQQITILESIADDASRLAPLLEDNGRLLREYQQQARALRIELPPEDIARLDEAGQSLAYMSEVGRGLAQAIGVELAPAVNGMADDVRGGIDALGGMNGVVEKGTALAGGLATVMAGRLAAAGLAQIKQLRDRLVAQHANNVALANAEAAEKRRAAAEQASAVQSAQLARQRAVNSENEAAARLRSIKITQQQTTAERVLETQRLQAQISATGRQQSLARLADLRRTEVSLAGQVTAAEKTLQSARMTTASASRDLRTEEALLGKASKAADGAMANAARTSSVYATAMTGLGKAARGTLALLGGWPGLIITAGAALYMLSDSSDDASDSVDVLRQSTDEFTASLKTMSAVSAGAALVRLREDIDDTRESLRDAAADVSRLEGELAGKGPIPLRGRDRDRAEDDLALARERLETAQKKLNTALERQNELQDVASGKWKASASAADDAAGALSRVEGVLGSSGDKWDDYRSKLEDARNTLGMTASEAAQYAAEQAGHTGLYAEQAAAIVGQSDALKAYQTAIEQGNAAEAQVQLERAQRFAEQEAMIQAQLPHLGELSGLLKGVQSDLSATALSAAMVVSDSTVNVSDLIEGILKTVNARAAAIKATTEFASKAKKDDAARELAAQIKEAQKAYQDLRDEFDPLGVAADKYAERQKALNLLYEQGKLSAEELDKAQAQLTLQYQNGIDPLNELMDRLDPAAARMREFREEAQRLREAGAAAGRSQLEISAAVGQLAKEYAKAEREADPYYQRTLELRREYDGSTIKARELEKALRDLNERYRNKDIGPAEYQRQLAGVREEMREAALESDPLAQDMAKAWEEAGERIDETFADAFTGAFDSFDSFADQLMDGFKRLLAELAYQATLCPIVVGFTGQMQGMLGLGSGGGGVGSGGLSNLSSLSSISKMFGGNSIGTGLESAGNFIARQTGFGASSAGGLYANAATGSAGLYNNVASGGLRGSGGVFSGAGNVSNLAMAGYGLGGSVVGGWANGALGFESGWESSVGSAAGAAIGTAILPGIGTGIGSALGSVVGGGLNSMFGSSRKASATIATGEKDQDWSGNLNRTSPFGTFGITDKSVIGGDVLSDSLKALQAYEQQLAEIMSPDQIEAVTDRLDGWSHKSGDVESLIEKRYDQLVDGVKSVADKPLKLMLEKVAEIDDWDFDARNEAFSAALQLDSIVNTLGGNVADYIKEKIENVSGSGFAARAEQVAADVNKYLAVQSAADQLGLNFDDLAEGAVYAGRNLVDAAGGLDAFNASISGYYQNFYTEAERTERATEQLNNVIGEFGLSADSTRQEFRSVVESLNLNTSSGREAYLTLMNVQQSFSDLVPWAEKTGNAIAEMMSASERADAKSKYVDTFGPLEFQIAEVRRELEGAIGSFAKLPTTVDEVRAERNRLSSERAFDERAIYESNSGLIKQYIDLLAKQEEQLRTTGDALNQYGMTQEQVNASKGTYIDTLAPLDFQISYYRDQLQSALDGIVDELPSTLSEAVAQRNRLAKDRDFDARGLYQSNSDLISKYVGLLDQERSIKQQAADAAREAADAEQQRLDALNDRRIDLQIQLLRAQGKEESAVRRERELELAALDASLQPLQERVWAAQDEAKALEEAARAQDEYQRRIESARDTLASFGKSVQEWLDDLNGTAKGLSSPADQLAAASAAYSEQLKLARSGDQDALNSITRYADRFLDAQAGWSGSGMQTQSLIDRLEREIGMLPDQLAPTDLLDDPVAKAIGQQTKDLSRVIDQNGDGTISQLELQRAQNEGLLGYSADSVGFGRKQAEQLGDVKHDIWEIRQFFTGAGQHANDYGGLDVFQRYGFDGSHATGLDNVPFDGYRAELHRGEAVITAADAPAVRDFLKNGMPTLQPLVMGPPNVYGSVTVDQRELIAAVRAMEKRLASIEEHSAAGVRVGQNGFTRMIEGQQSGNRSLKKLEDERRLEMSK